MMNSDDYRHFVCIVAGDNPSELMEPYDKNKKVEPYIVYRYSDAEEIRQRYIESYRLMLTQDNCEFEKEYINEMILDLSEMTADDFYYDITEGMQIDPENGNAISDVNKDGKWSYFNIGKLFSVPFLTKDGREVFQARKGEIDWDKIHLSNSYIYERAWDMVMNDSKPENDYEQQIYDNMHDKVAYFQKFENKDNYVISNTAFWGYAFVSEKTGWQEATEIDDQFVWMANFYNVFIQNLSDDTLLTIYECVR
jgi:hypothetical protein